MSTDSPWTPAAQGSADTPPARTRRPLLVVAVVLFAAGVLLTVAATVVPVVVGHDAPTWLYVGALTLTPVGFLLALVTVVVRGQPRTAARPHRDHPE